MRKVLEKTSPDKRMGSKHWKKIYQAVTKPKTHEQKHFMSSKKIETNLNISSPPKTHKLGLIKLFSYQTAQ